jgi:hypothetical protein
MTRGADETLEDFGPKDPVDLRPAENSVAEKQ